MPDKRFWRSPGREVQILGAEEVEIVCTFSFEGAEESSRIFQKMLSNLYRSGNLFVAHSMWLFFLLIHLEFSCIIHRVHSPVETNWQWTQSVVYLDYAIPHLSWVGISAAQRNKQLVLSLLGWIAAALRLLQASPVRSLLLFSQGQGENKMTKKWYEYTAVENIVLRSTTLITCGWWMTKCGDSSVHSLPETLH